MVNFKSAGLGTFQFDAIDVRFRARPIDVRFTTESGHVRWKPPCLLWAISGHWPRGSASHDPSVAGLVCASHQALPATCRVVTLTRLKKFVVAIQSTSPERARSSKCLAASAQTWSGTGS